MENHQPSNAKTLDLEWLMFDKRSPNSEPKSELLPRYSILTGGPWQYHSGLGQGRWGAWHFLGGSGCSIPDNHNRVSLNIPSVGTYSSLEILKKKNMSDLDWLCIESFAIPQDCQQAKSFKNPLSTFDKKGHLRWNEKRYLQITSKFYSDSSCSFLPFLPTRLSVKWPTMSDKCLQQFLVDRCPR